MTTGFSDRLNFILDISFRKGIPCKGGPALYFANFSGKKNSMKLRNICLGGGGILDPPMLSHYGLVCVSGNCTCRYVYFVYIMFSVVCVNQSVCSKGGAEDPSQGFVPFCTVLPHMSKMKHARSANAVLSYYWNAFLLLRVYVFLSVFMCVCVQ